MHHPPIPIDGAITFLTTRDLERTARFYEETMGLDLTLDQGNCRIYRVSDGGYLGFCQRDDAPEQPGVPEQPAGAPEHLAGVIFTIVTQEVDRWYDYLSERGVVFEKPPALNPKYNITHCFLRDPNGYLIEIQRFLDPAWASAQ